MRPRAAVGDDQRFADEGGHREPAAACQPVPRRQRDDRRLVEQLQELDPFVRPLRRPHEGEVEPAGQEPRQETCRLVLDDLHGDLRARSRPPLPEVVQQIGNQPGRRRVDRTDPEDARLPPPALVEPPLERFGLRQQRAHLVQQRGAIGQERHVARRPQQEGHAGRSLQQPDLTPERRGQHVEPPRRLSEMELLGDGDEAAELDEVHRRIIAGICIIPRRLWSGTGRPKQARQGNR